MSKEVQNHSPKPTSERRFGSRFEAELFAAGALEYDAEEEARVIEESRQSIRLEADMIRRARMYDRPHELEEEYKWQQQNSGQVPASWKEPLVVAEDMRKAHEQNVQLTSTLIDAGITHPVSYVRESTGLNQALTFSQLRRLLDDPNYRLSRYHILEAQEKFGARGKMNAVAVEVFSGIKTLAKG